MTINTILSILAFCAAIQAVKIVQTFEGPESFLQTEAQNREGLEPLFAHPPISSMEAEADPWTSESPRLLVLDVSGRELSNY